MKKINEVGIGAVSPGREPQGRYIRSIDLQGPTSNADSIISQRMQGLAYHDVDDYEDDDEIVVLECRVYRDGKYQLQETLERLLEIDSEEINIMDRKLSQRAKKSLTNIDYLEDLEDKIPMEEFMTTAALGGGPAVPIGYTAKGKPETRSQRRKRQNFNIKKSYPYTNLAKKPKSSKKRRKK